MLKKFFNTINKESSYKEWLVNKPVIKELRNYSGDPDMAKVLFLAAELLKEAYYAGWNAAKISEFMKDSLKKKD